METFADGAADGERGEFGPGVTLSVDRTGA